MSYIRARRRRGLSGLGQEGEEISTISGLPVDTGGTVSSGGVFTSSLPFPQYEGATPPFFDPGGGGSTPVQTPSSGGGWLAALLNLFTAGTKLATVATIQPGTVIAQPGGGYIARQTAGLPVGLNVGGISPNFLLWAAIGLGGLFIVSTAMSKR